MAELFDGVVVAGGDILRHDHGNSEIQRIMAGGGVIPSELFLEIVPPFFQRPDLANKPLFLSSVGRLMDEVSVIESATNDSGHQIKGVIYLKLSEEGVWQHFDLAKQNLDRGRRDDDTTEALKIRLIEFEKSRPVLDYYRNKGLLIEIDDSKETLEVTTEIIDALAKFAGQS